MTKAEAKKYVEAAAVRKHGRPDVAVWTVDLAASLNRTVDVEAADEDEARAKVADFLAAEKVEATV